MPPITTFLQLTPSTAIPIRTFINRKQVHKNIIETSINSGDAYSTTQIKLKLRKVHRITLSNKDLKGLYDDVKPQICKILYELTALELQSIDKSNNGGNSKSSGRRSRQSRSQEKNQRIINKDQGNAGDDNRPDKEREDYESSSSEGEINQDKDREDGSHQTGEKILKLPLITENWKCYLMITMEEIMAIRSIIRNSDTLGSMELGYKSKLVYNSVLVRDLVFQRRSNMKSVGHGKANDIDLIVEEDDGLFVGDSDEEEETAMKKNFRVKYKSKHVLPISLNVHVYSKN
ncbi:unnamed protein product [Ambrosiozyma monospora]|uniref:Unnamed protein product n=1 Tax=Ambrosiozyma monospora TaxID=43982 RepID=A0A9W6YY10_AMBMO|nr:unnamed protein product [Ambrosiozyma monospora]